MTSRPLAAELRLRIMSGAIEDYFAGRMAKPPRISELAIMNGVPSLVSIEPLISDSGAITQSRGSEYLHISAVRLDAEYAARLATEYQMPRRHLHSGRPQGDAATPPSRSPTRAAASSPSSQWERSSPGQALLNQTVPVIAGAFTYRRASIALPARRPALAQIARSRSRPCRCRTSRRARRNSPACPTASASKPSLAPRARRSARRRDRRATVLMLDLDRFKQVNDTLGHRAGDDLIQAVGQRLGQLLGTPDMLARLGGDEFAIIHVHAPGLDEPLDLAQRIIDAIGKPFDIFGSEAFVGVSIGIATVGGRRGRSRTSSPARPTSRSTKPRPAAATAPWSSKKSMNEFLQNRKTIEAELREALRTRTTSSRSRSSRCSAATARSSAPRPWRAGPIRASARVSPAHFIPVAEATGLIEQLGAFVLRAACAMGAKWPGHTFAVNISPVQLRNPDFPAQRLRAAGRDRHARPTISSSKSPKASCSRKRSDAAEALRLFRSAGIKIALDDFGTGYSSLNYLKRYPVDRIKIDRSFVSQLAPGSVSVAIVQAMVTLAHALNIEVTAEGVETEANSAACCSDLGCNVYPGLPVLGPVTRPGARNAARAGLARSASRNPRLTARAGIRRALKLRSKPPPLRFAPHA